MEDVWGKWKRRALVGHAGLLLGGLVALSCGGSASRPADEPCGGAQAEGGAGAADQVGTRPGGAGGEPQVAGDSGGGGDSAGGGAGGAGGTSTFDCDPGEVKLRAIELPWRSTGSLLLEYDEQGRLAVAGRDTDVDWYEFGYDSLGRLVTQNAGGGRDEVSYRIDYEASGALTVSDDDNGEDHVTYIGKRVTRSWRVPGSHRDFEYDYLGRLASITTLGGSTETFSYEYDQFDDPIRAISSNGPNPRPTREVFDEAGRHLFQIVETPDGKIEAVQLFADNSDPIRSLTALHLDYLLSARPWAQASVDPEGVADADAVGVDTGLPDLLRYYAFTTLRRDQVVDFDYDPDDDSKVSGRYSFDDEDRLMGFVLSIDDTPRIDLQLTYTPGLVTETVEYPASGQDASIRRFYFGCDDFELPAP